MALLAALTSLLLIAYVVLPVRRYYREQAAREFDRRLKLYKAWAVRNYYNELSDMSLEEIARQYDVDRAYHNMGKRFLRH
ncbi:MAG: hypothetical protein J5J00_02665 [Deltaproteobacteria bacterium]|nr:hypothetical protein [Deltaproteobacteria bacterium]